MKEFSKDLGNVSLAPKGKWSREQEYERLALVYNSCDNLSYVAKIDVPSGVDIENREYWQPMNATGYADNNFINLTTENENGTITAYETLEEAVATILPINRRAGATLSFYNLNSDRLDRQAEFELWQFNSTDLANWENKDYWNNVYYNWNVFVGWYIGADALKNHVKIPNVGQYAYVGSNLNDAILYQCRTNGTWTNTGTKVRNYISVVVGGNITIGDNGNWFSDGKDTGIPATPAVDEQLDNIGLQLQQHNTEIDKLQRQDVALKSNIDSNFETINDKVDKIKTDTDNKIDSNFETINNKVDNIKTDTDNKIDSADANLQKQITGNDNDIATLNTKHESLSKTVKGIAATGGASTATNVTYNKTNSGLNAENAQDAIDELQGSKVNKTAISQEFGGSKDKVISQFIVSRKFSNVIAKQEIIQFSINGKYIFKGDGSISNSEHYSITEKINVYKGDIILYNGFVEGSACEICLYKENSFSVLQIVNGKTTIPTDGYIIGCSLTKNAVGISIYNKKIDDNIDDVKHIKRYQNAHEFSIDGKYVYKHDGKIHSLDNYSITENIEVKAGDVILYNGFTEGNATPVCLYYDNTFLSLETVDNKVLIEHDGYIIGTSRNDKKDCIFVLNKKDYYLNNKINNTIKTIDNNEAKLQKDLLRLNGFNSLIKFSIEGKYVYKSTGDIYSLSSYSITEKINVKKGDIILYNGFAEGNAAIIGFWGEEGFESLTPINGELLIRKDGYIIASSQTDKAIGILICSELSSITITNYNKNMYIYKYTGNSVSWDISWGASYYTTDLIPVIPKEELIYEGFAEGNAVSVAFYDKELQYLSAESKAFKSELGSLFIVPDSARFMRVCSQVRYPTQPKVYRKTNSDLDNKKWLVIGDSISSTNYSNLSGNFYFDLIKNKYNNLVVTTLAVPGSRIAFHSGNTFSFVQRVSEAMSSKPDADIVTVFGGVNDWGQEKTSSATSPIPLGTMDDALPSSYKEATTFYKALKYLCNILIKNYPIAKIVFITPIGANPDNSVTTFARYKNSLGFTMLDYKKAINDVCSFYGIKVCTIVGLTPYVEEHKNTMFIPFKIDNLGGLHPNNNGHKVIAKLIEKEI